MKNIENKKFHLISLSDNELQLLMSILEEAEDDRLNMTCNDPYDEEEKLFTKKERIIIQKMLNGDEPEEEIDGFLFNNQYVEYLIERIKQQTEK